MSMTATADFKADAGRLFQRKRWFNFGVPAVILAYFVYIFFAFDIPGLSERASVDNARTLLADSYSHKTHVLYDARSDSIEIAIEGERKGTYAEGTAPDWVNLTETGMVAQLGNGHVVTYEGEWVRYDIPDFGVIEARPSRRGVDMVFPQGGMEDQPEWINVSKNRMAVTTDQGRLTVTRTRAELFKYDYGWELFFFTLDSPFHGKSFGELVSLAITGERVRPEVSNVTAMWRDFWGNSMWRHSEVMWAVFETVLMAFLGTFGAAMLALPLAFLAARNFSPLMAVRFGVRRVFDFVRGVDALIWTIVLARAFGPGPLTGALAILLTDTGTFGKLFSETLENVDEKEIEGVQSTGAKPMQRYRFGVIPQITPVLLSQLLYYLESNTRSATIIGAITGGGIGLLLTQAIITQKDWEEVSYYIVLIVLMVMAMDTISGWLRRRLIQSDDAGH
jgi:phosphonate transport system permease protein